MVRVVRPRQVGVLDAVGAQPQRREQRKAARGRETARAARRKELGPGVVANGASSAKPASAKSRDIAEALEKPEPCTSIGVAPLVGPRHGREARDDQPVDVRVP